MCIEENLFDSFALKKGSNLAGIPVAKATFQMSHMRLGYKMTGDHDEEKVSS